jgi:glycosyltransferase involved in cell wall biosynthesis
MKILIFAPSISTHSIRFTEWLLNRGCQVYFVDWHNPYPTGRPGFKFFLYGLPTKNRMMNKIFGQKFFSRMMASQWVVIPQIWLLWFLIKPDLVHVHYIDYRAIRCVKAGLHPLVLTAWGSDINYLFLADADPSYRNKIGSVLRKTDLLLADASDIIAKCEDLAGGPINSKLLSFGVDTNLFKPGYEQEVRQLRDKLDIPQNAKVLFSIRGWNHHYRHHIILEAFARALPMMQIKSYLVFKKIAHSDEIENYQLELLKLMEKLNVTESVRILEEVDYSQMPVIYAFSDIIVNYPSVDAFPVTFLEAAASECPVITCRLPSYENTFAEKYFRLVSSDSIDELISAMVEHVNENPEERIKNMAEARTYVQEHFEESKVIDKLLNLYGGLST